MIPAEYEHVHVVKMIALFRLLLLILDKIFVIIHEKMHSSNISNVKNINKLISRLLVLDADHMSQVKRELGYRVLTVEIQ